jgi:hypothetical protein
VIPLPNYPGGPLHAPGSQTSRRAAERMEDSAPILRRRVLLALDRAGERGLTADEAAHEIGRSRFAIRPRFTELRQLGHIAPTGERRKNASGASAAVLAITDAGRKAITRDRGEG